MRTALIVLSSNLVSLGFIGLAAYMISKGMESGWGWCLFCALCCASYPKFKNEVKEEVK